MKPTDAQVRGRHGPGAFRVHHVGTAWQTVQVMEAVTWGSPVDTAGGGGDPEGFLRAPVWDVPGMISREGRCGCPCKASSLLREGRKHHSTLQMEWTRLSCCSPLSLKTSSGAVSSRKPTLSSSPPVLPSSCQK